MYPEVPSDAQASSQAAAGQPENGSTAGSANHVAAPALAIRARSIVTLAGEGPSRGARLFAPLKKIDNAVLIVRGGLVEEVRPWSAAAAPGRLSCSRVRISGAGSPAVESAELPSREARFFRFSLMSFSAPRSMRRMLSAVVSSIWSPP